MSATLEGVESIHDRLMAKLSPETEEKEPLVAEESEVTVEPEVKAETVAEEEVEVAEPSESEAQEDEPSVELSHIAQYLGVDEDRFDVSDDGQLYVKTKIDGVEGRAKFSDLLKSYQLEGHLNKKDTELSETKKALQAKLAEAESQKEESIQRLESLSQIAYNELLTQFNSINWQELRNDDPAEWAAKQAEFKDRQSRIAQLYQEAQSQRSKKATDPELTKVKIEEETTKLLQAIPEWKDPAVLQKEWSKGSEYAATIGFSPEEYANTLDHRIVVLIDKARKYDALNKSTQDLGKVVKKAPKIAKPGSTASKEPNTVKKARDLKAQLKRDGGGKALHELLMSRL